MAQTQAVKFSCPSCSKEFNWRQEIAGKKAKCKCGLVIDIPAAPPPPPLPPPDVDPFDNPDYMYDFADEPAKSQKSAEALPPLPTHVDLQSCPNCGGNIPPGGIICLACGFNTKTGRKHKTEVARGSGGPVLPYQRRGLKREQEKEERHIDGYIVKDLYVPIGCIAAGTALAFVSAMHVYGVESFGGAAAWVGITTLVNLVLIFMGMLISIKLLSLSLGSPATAVLKLTAVALIPAPIADIIGYHIGPGGDYIGWSISMLFYYAMFMYFFDMDFNETLMCSVIIWVIRTWISWLLIAALFAGWMSGIGGSGGVGFGDDEDVDIPAIVDDGDDAMPANEPPQDDEE